MKKLICLALLLFLTACGAEKQVVPEDITVPEIGDVLEDISVTSEMAERGHLVIATAYEDQLIYTPHGIIEEARLRFEERFSGWTAEIASAGRLKIILDDGLLEINEDQSVEDLYFNSLPGMMRGTDDTAEQVPDIVGLLAADRSRLMEEGLLADLVPIFNSDPDFKMDKLLPGVARVMSDGGALYAVPSSFSFYGLVVSTDSKLDVAGQAIPSPWTWNNALEFFKPEKDRLELAWMIETTPQYLTEIMLHEYHAYYYDSETGTYDFNNEVFKEILQTVKNMQDMGMLPEWEAYDGLRYIHAEGGLIRPYNMDKAPRDFAALKTYGIGDYYPFPQLESAPGLNIAVYDELGINALSENKAAAWEFLKIFLSDEVQNSRVMRSQAVTANLTAAGVNQAQTRYADYELPQDELDAYNAGRLDFLESVTAKANYGAPDEVAVMIKHAESYFRGDLELDDMIAGLQTEMDETF